MDLSNLDTATGSEDGRWLDILGLNGKKLGMRIKVLGPDSCVYNKLADEVQKEYTRQLADAYRGLPPKEDKLTKEDREVTLYAKLTVEWESTIKGEAVTWEGEEFPCTQENAAKLYSKAVAIRNQIKSFVENRRNFTKPESQN